jgi:hypothetical protein
MRPKETRTAQKGRNARRNMPFIVNGRETAGLAALAGLAELVIERVCLAASLSDNRASGLPKEIIDLENI